MNHVSLEMWYFVEYLKLVTIWLFNMTIKATDLTTHSAMGDNNNVGHYIYHKMRNVVDSLIFLYIPKHLMIVDFEY